MMDGLSKKYRKELKEMAEELKCAGRKGKDNLKDIA
jgi:hypothetical protein